jgi:hypothetical protein
VPLIQANPDRPRNKTQIMTGDPIEVIALYTATDSAWVRLCMAQNDNGLGRNFQSRGKNNVYRILALLALIAGVLVVA